MSKIIDKPNLNILNQASIVSNLDPTNTSFDPTQVVDVQHAVVGGTVNIVESSSQLQPQAQPPLAMIPSFLMQPSPQPSGVSTSSLQIQAPAATTVVFQQPNNIIQQQQIVAPTAGDTALFQPSNGISSNAKAVVNVSTATASVGGATLQQQSIQNQNSSADQQQQQQQQQAQVIINQQQQQRLAVAQQMQTQHQQIQPMYQQEKQQLHNINNASSMNGRVPATRRDGRKLFVGGLPNEGE